MILMTEREKRQLRQTEEDAIFNRMLLCLVGAIIAEAIALFVKRFYMDVTAADFDIAMMNGLHVFFRIFAIAGLILAVLGIVWCFLAKKQGKALRLATVCTIAVGYIWIFALLSFYLNEVGVKIMMVLPIVAAVLILIYFLYHRAFFVNAILGGCGMAALWGVRNFYDGHATMVTILLVIGWICLAVIAVLAYVLKKNGGKLGKHKLVNDQKCYVPCWLTCVVVFAATLLALILGSGVAFYLIYVMVGWLICLAIYYTVKLM